MLAEAVHSVADTTNQAFLPLGMKLSANSTPECYPLGRSKESYFGACIVALFLFFMGGVFAIYEGVHKPTSPAGEPGSQIFVEPDRFYDAALDPEAAPSLRTTT